jgi:dTDP-4-dehydrorhamnose reductase
MRILILGASGMLGAAAMVRFGQLGYETQALSRAQFDIAHDPIDGLRGEIKRSDAVVNCAGVIKPMIAKTPIEDVLRVNAIFPRNIGRLCKAIDVPLIHITTDCVYTGAVGNYDETATFDADDVYGMSKNAGETDDAMVLRTSIIGEEFGQARSLLSWAASQRGKQVNGFTNHRWNGLTTTYLCDTIHDILKEKLFAYGIFHVHSPNTVTKDDLLKILSDVYELELTVAPVAAEVACDRSLSSIFPLSARIVKKTIQEQVEEMRKIFELSESEKSTKAV